MDYSRQRSTGFFLSFLLLCLLPASSFAALNLVSDNIPAEDGSPLLVNVSLANGLPLWYQDVDAVDGLRLAQCLEQEVEIDLNGEIVLVDPCGILGLLPQFPPSLANLDEVPYWQADSAFNYNSSQDGILIPGTALLVLALEGAGANALPFSDGNQAVFSRIRLRIDLPVDGTYRVTHPFGTFDYVISDLGTGVRAINQTQDVGITEAQNFLAAMLDRNIDFTDPANLPLDPLLNPPAFNPANDDPGAVVNENGATIGPFLVPNLTFDSANLMGGPVTATNGNQYIGLPAAPDLLPIFQPVTAGLGGVNFFRVELISDPPAGFFLNAADSTQIIESSDFLVAGKIFNDGPNAPPTAPEVTVSILKGRSSADIDVFAGLDAAGLDLLDPISDANVHGIDPQAIALADPLTGVFRDDLTNMPLLSQTETLLSGATVQRVSRLSTGQSLFRYRAPTAVTADGFQDSFHYVVQDSGGLLSEPAQVDVIIEDLQIDRADFRVRTGSWRISGRTDSAAETVTLRTGPQALLTSGSMQGTLVIRADSSDFDLANNTGIIDYNIRIDNIPAGTIVNSINMHVVGPGDPVMFRLCGNPFIFPFPAACTVTDGTLEIRRDFLNFDLLAGAGAADVLNFVDATDAILRGDTYISVVTSGGTFSGPVTSSPIAEVAVNNGTWSFRGKTGSVPGILPSVTARSSFGTRTFGTAVRLR